MTPITALLDPLPPLPAPASHTTTSDPIEPPTSSPDPETTGGQWLARSSTDPAACLAAWRMPDALAPLRIADHSPWHIISTDARLGDGALQALAAAQSLPGPTLLTDTLIHFWVPCLTTDWYRLLNGVLNAPAGPWLWGAALTRHLAPGHDGTLPCPAPGSIGYRARWIHAPDGSGTLTYAGALADAIHQAFRSLYENEPANPAPRAVPIAKPAEPAQADHFAAFLGRSHRTEAS